MNYHAAPNRSRTSGSPKPPRLLAKAIGLEAFAALNKMGIEAVIRQRYGNDPNARNAARWLHRTAPDIADTTTPGWAAELVGSIIAEFVTTVSPFSAFARLRSIGSAFTIDAMNRIVVPTRLNVNAPPNAAFTGEAGVIPIGMIKIGAGILAPVKVAGIAPLSQELLSASNGQVERAVTAMLLEDLAARIDLVLTDSRPAIEGLRPAGLLHDVAPIASVDADTDIAALAGAMSDAKARIPALILDPARLNSLYGHAAYGPQLMQGQLGPFLVVRSMSMADPQTVIAVDAAAFAAGLGEPEILTGRNAALTMASADAVAPTQAITAAGVIGPPGEVLPDGGIPIVGGPVGAGTANVEAMSMLQHYAIALRCVEPITWAMTRAGAVAAVTGADW